MEPGSALRSQSCQQIAKTHSFVGLFWGASGIPRVMEQQPPSAQPIRIDLKSTEFDLKQHKGVVLCEFKSTKIFSPTNYGSGNFSTTTPISCTPSHYPMHQPTNPRRLRP